MSLLRRLTAAALRGAWAWAERQGRITSDDPGGRRFGRLGQGVTLGAGLSPGMDLGPDPVLRVGEGCLIGRSSHVAAHESVTIGGVPARILRRHAPGTGWTRPGREKNPMSLANPERTPDMIDIMIVGDSISHGSSGDWTWRYRFWKHLREHDVSLDLVGPKATLDNIRTAEVGDDDTTYADPEFDPDHDAQWGRPYLTEKDEIEAKVREHGPDYLLVLLGINDLFWYGVEPPRFEANLREFIANARRAEPELSIVLGTILQTRKALDEPAFAALVDASNDRIRAVATDLDSPSAAVVAAETAAEFRAPEHTWDGTHPNPDGELRIAAAFCDVLAARFGVGAPYPRPFPDVPPVAADAKSGVDG